jgi:RNA polymerase sigma-70 factor (ECF subfamily)
MTDTENITELLAELHTGREDVLTALLPKIRNEVRRIANRLFSKEGARHHCDPSDLVQETFVRLLMPGKLRFNNRAHFFALAAISVRQQLIEKGRALRAVKRGGGEWIQIELNEALPARGEHWSDLLDVDEALQRLEALSLRHSRIVEYRVFGGMSIKEVAEALGITTHAVKRDWAIAAAFLRRELRAYVDARAVEQN